MNRFRWMSLKKPRPLLVWLRKEDRSGTRTSRKGRILAWIAFSMLAVAPARAQRLLAWPVGPGTLPPIVRPMPPGPMPMPVPLPRPDAFALPLEGSKIEGQVRAQVATLWVEVTFHNDTARRLEGELLLPIPGDAVIDKLEMTVNGKTMKAELLDADRARATYEGIVRQMRDPALLELQSERLVRARVFPIEPHGDVRLRFDYTQILPQAGGLYALHLPVAKADGASTAQTVKVDFQSESPIRLLYSPTHDVQVHRTGDKKALIEYSGIAKTQGDMVVLYSLAQGELASSIAAYRDAGEDGTFLISLAPKLKADGKPSPKDIVFVIDRSGSMEDDNKMVQAKKALAHCLSRLGPEDRFGIVDFATGVQTFRPALVAATLEMRTAAKRYVESIDASGGTNMEGGLDAALEQLGPRRAEGRVPMIVLLTDGLPTVGETNTDALLRKEHAANTSVGARLFCLGVGSEVNSLFLDKLAEGQHGARDYVLPGEDIEVKMGALVDRISKPALTGVRLEWEGVEVAQVYPKEAADIYYGDPLVLMGRYSKPGHGKLTLTAKSGGKDVRLVFPFELPRQKVEHAYLPRLWAQRKVAQLMDELRMTGSSNPEIVNEIAKLARQYGIVTPYTSLLIAEDKDMAVARREAGVALERMARDAAATGDGAIRAHAMSDMLNAAKSAPAAAPAMSLSAFSGRMIAGAASGARGEAFRSGAAFDGGAGGLGFDEKEKQALSRLDSREVGSKTFYLRDGEWRDGALEAAEEKPAVEEVAFLSARYFELLRAHPEAKAWLSLGKKVTFMLGGKAYRIVE
jgi:Ca-activated chloride channel family protein